jgi:hypothetical protein
MDVLSLGELWGAIGLLGGLVGLVYWRVGDGVKPIKIPARLKRLLQ